MRDDLLKALESLPESLSKTYKHVLDSIPYAYLQHSKRILAFLTYSERPLKISEAVDILATTPQKALKFDPGNRMPQPMRILKFCSSLVTLAEDRQHISLAHFSVKEYLISDADKGLFTDALKPTVAHAAITDVLVSYLSCLTRNETNIEERYPLLEYGAEHWFKHAKHVFKDIESTQQRIINFMLNEESWYISLKWHAPVDDDIRSEASHIPNATLYPLYYTSLKGLPHTAERLLDLNVLHTSSPCQQFGPPLRAACCKSHSDVAEVLIRRGAQIEFNDSVHSFWRGTVLVPAILNGMTSVVELLLERGINPNLGSLADRDDLNVCLLGCYPLNAASFKGSVDMVKALIDHGADVQQSDDSNGAALMDACAMGHLEIAKLLIDRGADVQKAHSKKGTALMSACFAGHATVAELLINSGATIDFVAESFELNSSRYEAMELCTALILACYAGHMETVELLINKGADVDRSWSYNTALTVARSRGHENVVQTLVKYGATEVPTELGEDLRHLFEYSHM